jgi:hypothetical protein
MSSFVRLRLPDIAAPERLDSPIILSLSKDERLAYDTPAEGRAIDIARVSTSSPRACLGMSRGQGQ